MNVFDTSKPAQTRDGRGARIVCTDMNGSHPIVAVVRDFDGEESAHSFTIDGAWLVGESDGLDLVNIPESKWMNLYEDPMLLAKLNFYTPWSASREEADKAAKNAFEICGTSRVGIIELTASGEFRATRLEASNAK